MPDLIKRKRILLCCILFLALAVGLMRYAALRPPDVRLAAPAEAGRARFTIPVNSASADELRCFLALTVRRTKALVRERGREPFRGPEDLARVKELPPSERERILHFIVFNPGDAP